MIVMRSATLGFALALGAAGAQAQGVVTQRIDNEPVMTTVTQGPAGTVITRQPLAAVPAPAVTTAVTTSEDETIGVAPVERRTRSTRLITHHVVHHEHVRRVTRERTVTHSVRATRRTVAARPLMLAPAQRQVIYRTLVQQRVVPAGAVAPPPRVPGYPPFPPPAVSRAATTGYAVPGPVDVVDDDVDDAPAAPVAAAEVYPVGAVLPARVAVAPLPVSATAAVPVAQPYEYAVVGSRVLLVDPESNTVVADITTP